MNHPSMFRLAGVPPSFFGETHIVITVWCEGSVWKSEYSMLTKRPAHHLVQRVMEFDVRGYPPELPPIDKDFMEGEAIAQAKVDLILELEQRAKAVGREDLAYLPIELQRETITPVTLWAHNIYPQKFVDMVNETQSVDLKRYLQLVMSIGQLKPAN